MELWRTTVTMTLLTNSMNKIMVAQHRHRDWWSLLLSTSWTSSGRFFYLFIGSFGDGDGDGDDDIFQWQLNSRDIGQPDRINIWWNSCQNSRLIKRYPMMATIVTHWRTLSYNRMLYLWSSEFDGLQFICSCRRLAFSSLARIYWMDLHSQWTNKSIPEKKTKKANQSH